MKKILFVISLVLLITSFSACKKSGSSSDGNSSNSSSAVAGARNKKFIGKWKASLPAAPGKDQIWVFKKDGGFEWHWAGIKYNGKFEIKNKKLVITFPAKTTVYEIAEESTGKFKLITTEEGTKIITFLTKMN